MKERRPRSEARARTLRGRGGYGEVHAAGQQARDVEAQRGGEGREVRGAGQGAEGGDGAVDLAPGGVAAALWRAAEASWWRRRKDRR